MPVVHQSHRFRFSRVTPFTPEFTQSLALITSILIVSLSGSLKVYFAEVFLGMPVSFAAVAVGGLITFSAYAFDRAVPNSEDQERSGQMRKMLITLTLISFVLCFVLWPSPALLSPFLIAYAYSKGIAGFRLKGGAGVKNAVVGLTWSVLLVVLIGRFDPAALLVYVFFFIKSFVNTTVYDVRDIDADRAAGIRTLPTVLSLGRLRTLLIVLTVLVHVAMLAIWYTNLSTGTDVLLLSGLHTSGYILLYTTGYAAWRNVLVDGEWLFYGGFSIIRAFLT
ncbi:MAG: UbiA family prenyltransferase [Methanomicrobiaceae archaeon]|nr:UbiA family prenyltransferase [Methanomicrobiaceae archaeon]